MISFNSLISILTLITALGCGTIAGVFFAFSTFVMKAILPPYSYSWGQWFIWPAASW